MADPQFKRGPAGDPNAPQPGYGEAQALNDALPAAQPADQAPGAQAPADQQTADQTQEPIPGVNGHQPTIQTPQMPTDAHKFLFAPTDRPREDVTHGMLPNGRLHPPPDLMEWLPDLQDAAKQPDASPQLRAFYDAIAQNLAASGQ